MAVSLRVLTYNVLLGGTDRWGPIQRVLEAVDADVVALQEVDEPEPCRRVAEALGYTMVLGRASMPRHQAVLSRWPVQERRNHRDPAIFLRNSLEVLVAAPAGAAVPQVRLHTVHLPAAFQRRGRGELERVRELRAVRRHAARVPGAHLVLGDCNALAPGDPVAASAFFERMSRWRRQGVLDAAGAIGPTPQLVERIGRRRAAGAGPAEATVPPRATAPREAPSAAGEPPFPAALYGGIPRLPWMLPPLLEAIPRGAGTDLILGSLLPREAVQGQLDAGYLDCRPTPTGDDPPFTCPTYEPAVRIDYVFASPELAPAFTGAVVVGQHGRLAAVTRAASDHFPVLATFDLARARGPAGAGG